MKLMSVRMFYVDDSGATDNGFIVYAWVECLTEDWSAGLRSWLDLRAELFAKHAIPPSYELHTAAFAGGRGRPSTIPDWNLHKRNRSGVLELALTRIAGTDCLRIGSACRVTAARGSGYAAERARRLPEPGLAPGRPARPRPGTRHHSDGRRRLGAGLLRRPSGTSPIPPAGHRGPVVSGIAPQPVDPNGRHRGVVDLSGAAAQSAEPVRLALV